MDSFHVTLGTGDTDLGLVPVLSAWPEGVVRNPGGAVEVLGMWWEPLKPPPGRDLGSFWLGPGVCLARWLGPGTG